MVKEFPCWTQIGLLDVPTKQVNADFLDVNKIEKS
jgi:hypothetical protein